MKLFEIAQGYANAGIEIVEDQILNNPSRPLDNFANWLLKDGNSKK